MRGWRFIFAAIAALSIGCASNGPIEVGTELTYDGLLPVENARASAVWIRPDFDLSGYTRVRLQGAGIQFRPVRGSGSRSAGRTSQSEFPLDEGAKERLRDVVATAFQEELARSEVFELTEESGPDVLTVWGGLLDVVSFVPPDALGRGNIYLSRVGEVTLVIELRDSESNATLARIVDRRAAERVRGGAVMPSNRVTNTAEVRRLANRWARLLRQRLEQAPTLRGGEVMKDSE